MKINLKKKLKLGLKAGRGKVRNKVFKRYNKVKYLLRIKHWRGRDVHSPFTYRLVRSALMYNKNNFFYPDRKMAEILLQNGVSRGQAYRVCRVYAYLGFNSYVFGAENYGGEDMLFILSSLTEREVDNIAVRMKERGGRSCMVLFSLYETPQRHKIWNYIVKNVDAVAIDLYYTGFLFFDDNLNKQCYKMMV